MAPSTRPCPTSCGYDPGLETEYVAGRPLWVRFRDWLRARVEAGADARLDRGGPGIGGWTDE